MIRGSDILIYEGGTAIAGTRDYTLTETMGTLENSSPFSGSARAYEATLSGWEVNVTRLLTAVKGTVLHPGQAYTLALRTRGDSGNYATGTALCIGADVTATVGNLVRGTWQFVGVGALSYE